MSNNQGLIQKATSKGGNAKEHPGRPERQRTV